MDSEQLLELTHQHRIQDYFNALRAEHPIDYDHLTQTAKSLKTLNEDARRTAISYFKKIDNESSEDESSSNNKNLVDQMLEKISQIDYQQGSQERSALKKRWWTQEEDEKLKQLVD